MDLLALVPTRGLNNSFVYVWCIEPSLTGLRFFRRGLITLLIALVALLGVTVW